MNNFPPGVTQGMVDHHFGGPEDEGNEILIPATDLSFFIYLTKDALVVQVINHMTDVVQEEYSLDLPEARELAEAISRRVL